MTPDTPTTAEIHALFPRCDRCGAEIADVAQAKLAAREPRVIHATPELCGEANGGTT